MFNVPESAAAGSGFRCAEHAVRVYEADIEVCRKLAVKDGALHYVAHITSGIFDFAFEQPGVRPQSSAVSDAFDRAGRQLNLTVTQLDETCRPLDSGTLTRVVIQGDSGALFQFLKRTSQTFFGLTLGGSRREIDEADSQMARLSESAVRRIGAQSLNWGGFKDREASGELRQTYQLVVSARPAISPYVARSDFPVPDEISRACRAALGAGGLHFVGIYRGGRQTWCADVFDDPALEPLFQRVTPELRRSGYSMLARQVHLQSRRLEQLLDVVRSDRLTRLVLEVARGGIFVLPLTQDDYLVGATLDQAGVRSADGRAQGLQEKIRGLWRTHLWRMR